MNSLAVITRAYDAEAPYIDSFVEHYERIGIAEFHIVVPKGNKHQFLLAQCAKRNNVTVYTDYDFNEGNKVRGVQNIALPYVKASHVLSVDVDEYLDVENVASLLMHDYVRLNWIIVPNVVSTHLTKPHTLLGFQDRQCKYIVKKDNCKFLGEHDCKLHVEVPQIEVDAPLIHYVYRSYNDLFLKCTLSKYDCYQATDVSKLTDCKESLPLKYKMAAIYTKIAHISKPLKVKNHCNINLELENTLVNSTPAVEYIDELELFLVRYMNRIDVVRLIKKVLTHRNYKRSGRLPHNLLAKLADETLLGEIKPENWIKKPNNLVFLKRLKSILNLST